LGIFYVLYSIRNMPAFLLKLAFLVGRLRLL
jgi:hypothetical protein